MPSSKPPVRRTECSPARPAASIVFVVDDDVSVRESLEGLIRTAGWRPRTFATARDFLACSGNEAPACVVLDVELPDLNGLDVQARLAADGARLPIIFITGHGDIPMSVRAMKAGAAEFLTKPFERDVLLAAIRRALEQSRAACGHAAEVAALTERYASLTPRQREVFAWVAAGLLNKQVGSELGMTEATVKVHRGHVMHKMQAGSFADLVRIAGRLGLALPSPVRARHHRSPE
jgi:FixJ family two-component response regulator